MQFILSKTHIQNQVFESKTHYLEDQTLDEVRGKQGEERNTSKGYLSNGFKERCIERGRREDNLRKAAGSRDDTVEMCPWTHIRNSM